MKLTEENVLKVLAELGSTPTQVAESLKTLGIKGLCHSSSSCPIAVYLKQKFPGYQVGVTTLAVMIYKIENGSPTEWVSVKLPPVITFIIEEVDMGRFQFLSV